MGAAGSGNDSLPHSPNRWYIVNTKLLISINWSNSVHSNLSWCMFSSFPSLELHLQKYGVMVYYCLLSSLIETEGITIKVIFYNKYYYSSSSLTSFISNFDISVKSHLNFEGFFLCTCGLNPKNCSLSEKQCSYQLNSSSPPAPSIWSFPPSIGPLLLGSLFLKVELMNRRIFLPLSWKSLSLSDLFFHFLFFLQNNYVTGCHI